MLGNSWLTIKGNRDIATVEWIYMKVCSEEFFRNMEEILAKGTDRELLELSLMTIRLQIALMKEQKKRGLW